MNYPNDVFNSEKCDTKIRLSFRTKNVANDLVNHPTFKANKLLAYIPEFKITCQGVIKGIPFEYTTDEIKKQAHSPIPIKNISRFNRFRVIDGLLQSQSTKSLLITFEGQSRPDRINLYGNLLQVHPYVSQVKRCGNCLRFGHTKKDCQSSSTCDHCSEEAHGSDIQCPKAQDPPKCINCKGPHNSRSNTCPKLAHQRNIHSFAVHNGISYLEARGVLSGKAKIFTPSQPTSFNPYSFPPLHKNSATPVQKTHFTQSSNQSQPQSSSIDQQKIHTQHNQEPNLSHPSFPLLNNTMSFPSSSSNHPTCQIHMLL